MAGSANPGASRRAEAELLRDPFRSNYLIAIAAGCTPQHAGVVRRGLEQAGLIGHVKPADRASGPGRSRSPAGRDQ
jgi:hypothetical protein